MAPCRPKAAMRTSETAHKKLIKRRGRNFQEEFSRCEHPKWREISKVWKFTEEGDAVMELPNIYWPAADEYTHRQVFSWGKKLQESLFDINICKSKILIFTCVIRNTYLHVYFFFCGFRINTIKVDLLAGTLVS